jgi:tetratricopeptide (TPR) repeat protein
MEGDGEDGRSLSDDASSANSGPIHLSPNSKAERVAKKDKKAGKKAEPSQLFLTALIQVKEFMTDSQKAHILLREGKLLIDSGDFLPALECFSEGISYNPTLVSLYTSRASAHKSLNMWQEAYFDYSFCIRIEPDVSTHYSSRGICLLKLKRVTLAVEDLDTACRMEPTSHNFFSRGTIMLENGKYELAIKDLSRTIEIDRESSNPAKDLYLRSLYKRALGYFELGKYNECKTDLQILLTDDTNSVQARVLLGKAFKMTNDLKAADDQLSNAIIFEPEQYLWYLERGDVRLRSGRQNQLVDAAYDFDKAITLMSDKIAKVISTHDSKLVSKLRAKTTEKLKELGSNSTKELDLENLEKSAENMSISHGTYYESVFGLQDLEEQMVEIYFKRASAKLLLSTPDDILVKQALSDALKALSVCPKEEKYLLVASSCCIRLNKCTDALVFLKRVLSLNPNNENALYQLSYCERNIGKPKDAIEGLTKIIKLANCDIGDSTGKTGISIPIHRIYETRGTLFHEIQAHKLALADLGRAVALNPDRPENFFLLADCHARLGNFEQAIKYYTVAELKGFLEGASLYIARGSVYRIMRQGRKANADFDKAHELLPKTKSFTLCRLKSMHASSFIDMEQFSNAYVLLMEAKIIAETLRGSDANPELFPNDFSMTNKIEILSNFLWIVNYHISLCFYKQQNYESAVEYMDVCLNKANVQYCPDSYTLGIISFFHGISLTILARYVIANASFNLCLETSWCDSDHNRSIVSFAIGKGLQVQGKHREAIDSFDFALQYDPNNPYVLFRRAWSFKELEEFDRAGGDFELAKNLKLGDPNFSMAYMKISNICYIELRDDPDMNEPFPALMPIP